MLYFESEPLHLCHILCSILSALHTASEVFIFGSMKYGLANMSSIALNCELKSLIFRIYTSFETLKICSRHRLKSCLFWIYNMWKELISLNLVLTGLIMLGSYNSLLDEQIAAKRTKKKVLHLKKDFYEMFLSREESLRLITWKVTCLIRPAMTRWSTNWRNKNDTSPVRIEFSVKMSLYVGYKLS